MSADRHSWHTGERQDLKQLSGVLSPMAVGMRLGVRRGSVEAAVKSMRAAGEKDDEGFEPSTRWVSLEALRCPVCDEMRPSLYRTGACRICRLRERLESLQADNKVAYDALDSEQRSHFHFDNPKRYQYAVDPLPPKSPDKRAYSYRYEYRLALRRYYQALEDHEAMMLIRAKNRVKKETQRMREQTGTNPLKGKEQGDDGA